MWCMSAGTSFLWKILQVWDDLNHLGSCRKAPNWSFAVILITHWASFWDCVCFSRLHCSFYCLTCWFGALITKHFGLLGCDWVEQWKISIAKAEKLLSSKRASRLELEPLMCRAFTEAASALLTCCLLLCLWCLKTTGNGPTLTSWRG